MPEKAGMQILKRMTKVYKSRAKAEKTERLLGRKAMQKEDMEESTQDNTQVNI